MELPRWRSRRASRPARFSLLIIEIVIVSGFVSGSVFGIAPTASGESPVASSMTSATLPPVGEHFVWVTDNVFVHSQLFDGDTGAMVATVDSGTTLSPKPPHYSPRRDEFYSVEIDYDRGRRGRRIDFVTIYDAVTLEVTGEIIVPTRAGESAASLAYTALLDGERFLAVFNQFPVTSVSIIDLEERVFVGAIPAAGCAGIYPTGPRVFAMLCGNGSVNVFALDEAGMLASRTASEPFFDTLEDPAMLAAGRIGTRWIFPTFLGTAWEVDFATTPPTASSWPLVSEAERGAGWRPGGRQLAALNELTGRFYVLMHRGEAGSHKSPGPELWVYDVAEQSRIDTFEVPNMTAGFLRDTMKIGTEGFVSWLLETVVPDDGADTVTVTRDSEPLVFLRFTERGSVAVLDGQSGEHLRNLTEVGLGGTRLEVPR